MLGLSPCLDADQNKLFLKNCHHVVLKRYQRNKKKSEEANARESENTKTLAVY